jgi:hypothetical protein
MKEDYKLKREYYSVYEKEPRHQNEKNGVILAPFNTKEEAEETRVKYGYGNDNYYVDKLMNLNEVKKNDL